MKLGFAWLVSLIHAIVVVGLWVFSLYWNSQLKTQFLPKIWQTTTLFYWQYTCLWQITYNPLLIRCRLPNLVGRALAELSRFELENSSLCVTLTVSNHRIRSQIPDNVIRQPLTIRMFFWPPVVTNCWWSSRESVKNIPYIRVWNRIPPVHMPYPGTDSVCA